MKPGSNAKRLRIYVSSTDKLKHTPLYEVIVYAAKRYGIAGATVIKGTMGFGASSEIYSNKFWEISEKIPLIIEIIDEPAKIDSFFDMIRPYFDKAAKGHIITMEDTTVILHKAGTRLNG